MVTYNIDCLGVSCMSKVLHVGLLGCGRITYETHIPILRRVKDVEIVAVCDKNKETAKKTAKMLKIPRYFTELSDMLDDGNIDIINNCTPVGLHASTSIQAMEHGCHVLVEKPMALQVEEANKLIHVSNRKKVKLGVIHNTLFNPAVVKMRALVQDGRLGDIIGMDIKYFERRNDGWVQNKNHWSHKLPGGMFGELLAHPIYLERDFIGDLDVIAVHSRKFSSFQWIKSDELRVIVDGEKGIGTITTSLNAPRNEEIIDIYGTDMNLHIDLPTATIIKYKPTTVPSFPTSRDSVSLGKDNLNRAFQRITCTFTNATKFLFGRLPNGHQIIIPQFIESVRCDETPLITAEDGREVVKVLEEITKQIEKQVRE